MQSVSKKLDESNDKVIILSNSLVNLQSTVETLQKQANSNLPLQKIEKLEYNQILPPSGQEVHSTATQDNITKDLIPVANRTITVKENVSSAQSNKNMAATTTPDIKVTSNAKVIIQSIDHKWEEFIVHLRINLQSQIASKCFVPQVLPAYLGLNLCG